MNGTQDSYAIASMLRATPHILHCIAIKCKSE